MRSNGTSVQQESFFEAFLLAVETEPTPTAPPAISPLKPIATIQASGVTPTRDEMANLFRFISEVNQLRTNTATDDATQHDQDSRIIAVAQEQCCLTPQWILENCPEHLSRILAVLNSMCEFDRLPPLEHVENILASQLVSGSNKVFADDKVKQTMQERAHNLETFAHSLYGDATLAAPEEIARCANALLESMPRQPYEGEIIWIRRAMQVAARKTLSGKSQNIYAALIAATMQRPVRESVRELLQANQIPFRTRVLAQVRARDYPQTIRESLQTLARLGFTAQTTMLAWQAARHGQTDSQSSWIARRADGCAAVILNGHAILETRVVRSPNHAILAMFDAAKRIMRQMTLEASSIEEAKKSLWAQGYRHGEEGFPLADRVVRLWCDVCRARDNGWWFGDAQGRVMVVIPYVLKRRLGYHKSLCGAVAQMQAWGYHFQYDEHTLYFMPEGVHH